jgi:glycosyltransferase involved in cell wall biosynthesis
MNSLSEKIMKMPEFAEWNVLQAEQDFSIGAARRIKQKTGIPLIADLHNITAEELVAAKLIDIDGRAFRDLQHQTADNLSYADVVVVVSELMQEYVIAQYGMPRSKVVVVPPGGRPRENHGIPALQQNHSFVYSGLLSYRENVELFVRSMPIILEKIGDAKFFLTKKGELLGHLSSLAASLNISPTFFWYEKISEFYNFLSNCYAGVLTSSDDLARRMGTPAKLFDYMAMGLPVVANDVGGWTEIVRKFRVGILTGSTPTEFADGVCGLTDNLREEFAQNGRKLIAQQFNWDNSSLLMLETYRRVMK